MAGALRRPRARGRRGRVTAARTPTPSAPSGRARIAASRSPRGRRISPCPGARRPVDSVVVVAIEQHDDTGIAGRIGEIGPIRDEAHRSAVGIVVAGRQPHRLGLRRVRLWRCRAAGSRRRGRSRDGRRSPRSAPPSRAARRFASRARGTSRAAPAARAPEAGDRGGRTELPSWAVGSPRHFMQNRTRMISRFPKGAVEHRECGGWTPPQSSTR